MARKKVAKKKVAKKKNTATKTAKSPTLRCHGNAGRRRREGGEPQEEMSMEAADEAMSGIAHFLS